MDFKEITLSDRDLIQSFLNVQDYQISDISFGNLFLWKSARKIAYTILQGCLVIQTTYANQMPFYFFPIGGGDKLGALHELLAYCRQHDQILEFHSLQKDWLEFLQAHFKLESFLNRDRSDYIYHIPELIALSGRKYHKKKNHLNKFLQTHPDFSYEAISAQNAMEVSESYQIWFEKAQDHSKGLQDERIGIKEVLKHWDCLHLKGGAVRVEGRIAGFSFGEEISKDMAVIHIEKADAEIPGAYQIINQQFLKNTFCHLLYANREEDLGIEGLRQAKMSYNPAFLVKKYEAKILEVLN